LPTRSQLLDDQAILTLIILSKASYRGFKAFNSLFALIGIQAHRLMFHSAAKLI